MDEPKRGKGVSQKRNPVQRDRDLALITDLYCKGWSQSQIAVEVGRRSEGYTLTRQQIGYDLARVRELWLERATQDFHAARAEELQKVDMLERTYWDAWERSLTSKRHQTQYMRARDDGEGVVADRGMVQITPEGEGDMRALAGVQWCIDARCRILGLLAPDKLMVKTDTVEHVVLQWPESLDNISLTALPQENVAAEDVIDVEVRQVAD